MTFGEGVPEEATWGRLLASSLQVEGSYANLGIRGASIGQIVLNTFAYIKKFGNPKYLFCLFPDFKRMEFVFHKDLIVDEYGARKIEDFYGEDINISRSHLHTKNFIPPKYMKSPVCLQDVMPLEHAIFQSMGYIDMLTTYCNATGVKFLWSTWDYEFSDECANREYPNYVDVVLEHRVSNIHNMVDVTCHKELLQKYRKNFYQGLDEAPHWGVHQHAHLADLFLSNIS